MWRYLPVSKVNSDKKTASDKNTAPPQEYDGCGWCTEHRKALETQNVLTSSKFIDGCSSLLFVGREREDRQVCRTGGKGPYDRQSVTYEIKCTECHNVYVGETSRSADTRGKEQEKSLSKKEERNIVRRKITRNCRLIPNECYRSLL